MKTKSPVRGFATKFVVITFAPTFSVDFARADDTWTGGASAKATPCIRAVARGVRRTAEMAGHAQDDSKTGMKRLNRIRQESFEFRYIDETFH